MLCREGLDRAADHESRKTYREALTEGLPGKS